MAKNNGAVSGWVGWIGFAGFMLMLGGFFAIIAGIAALFKTDAVFHSASSGSVWVLDYSQWGWVHIFAGLLALGAAGSLAAGHIYGRTIAVIVALLSATANMAFVPVAPVWSILVITIDLLVIFAVTVHGKDIQNLQ